MAEAWVNDRTGTAAAGRSFCAAVRNYDAFINWGIAGVAAIAEIRITHKVSLLLVLFSRNAPLMWSREARDVPDLQERRGLSVPRGLSCNYKVCAAREKCAASVKKSRPLGRLFQSRIPKVITQDLMR